MATGNMFGGKNANSLYTPMSESEQEALARLRDEKGFVVDVKGFGSIKIVDTVTVGDHRIALPFNITFNVKDGKVVKVPFLDLTLRTTSGILLFHERLPFRGQDGNAQMVSTGLTVPLIWHIGINQMDPKVVKAIMPAHVGLTTRRGNEQLSSLQQVTLRKMREGEQKSRQDTKETVVKVIHKCK